MLKIRKSEDRGHVCHSWLDTRHTFSFADYHDPDQMGYRALRVINEDVIDPGCGFPTHPHRDMEIVTYVLDGELEHKDDMGNGSVIRPGDVQYMRAGSGVRHSEFNPSLNRPVHLLQIWMIPAIKGLAPAYGERHFPLEDRLDRLCPVVTRDGRDDSLLIMQDVDLYASVLDPGGTLNHDSGPGRHLWLQLAAGRISVNDLSLGAGDGLAVEDESRIEISAETRAEFLLFDLA